jgi:hypothetical protein
VLLQIILWALQPLVRVSVSRTRGLAVVVRDQAQVVAEAARGLGRTAVVDPDQERAHMAAAPDQHQERAPIAAAPDPDQEQGRTAAAPERAQITAGREPGQEPDRMAAAPERGQIAAGREPDREQSHTAAGPEKDLEAGRAPDQEQGPMVAGRAPARRRAAADLHRAKRAVVLAEQPASTVVPAQDLDRAADRGRNRGSTAVRAG